MIIADTAAAAAAQRPPARRGGWLAASSLALLAGACQPPADTAAARDAVPVWVTPQAGATTRAAAALLSERLGAMHPSVNFPVTHAVGPSKRAILLSADAELLENWGLDAGAGQIAGSFVVTRTEVDGREIGAVYGADEEGVLNGAHALLARLGHGFYLSTRFDPPPSDEPFDFAAWQLAGATPIRRRVVVDGAAFGGAPEPAVTARKAWLSRAAALRFNAVMLHWDAGHPALSSLQAGAPARAGARAPLPYALHAELGAPASAAGASGAVERAAAALRHAKTLGMAVDISLDLDAETLHPPAAVARLGDGARWCTRIGCLPRPDTDAGHAFYRERLRSLLTRYPQIDRLTLWLGRAAPSEWERLGPRDLPESWRRQGAAGTAQRIASRIVESLSRALSEIGRADLSLAVGAAGYDWLAAADALYPQGVAFAALERATRDGRAALSAPKRLIQLDAVSDTRRVVPIWLPPAAHALAGRPRVPAAGLRARLLATGAAGFGAAPSGWTEDLWLADIAAQLWSGGAERGHGGAVSALAAALAPDAQRPAVEAFLEDWARTAVVSGADADADWQRADAVERLAERAESGRARREQLLARVDESTLGPAAAEYLRGFAALDRAWASYAALRRGWLLAQGGQAAETDLARAAAPSASAALLGLVRWAPESRRRHGPWGKAVALPAWLPSWQRKRWALGDDAWRLRFGPDGTAAGDASDGEPAPRYWVDSGGQLWRHAGPRRTGALAWRADAAGRSAAGADAACARGVLLHRPLALRLGDESEALSAGRYRLRALLAAPFADGAVIALSVRADGEPLVRAEVNIAAQADGAARSLTKAYALTIAPSANATLTATPLHGLPALCGVTFARTDAGARSAPAHPTDALPALPALGVSTRLGRIYHAPDGMRYRELDDYLQLPKGTVWRLPDGVVADDLIADGATVVAAANSGERQAYRFTRAEALSVGRPVQASREQRTPLWGIASALAEHAVDGEDALDGDPFWATMDRRSAPGWLQIDLGDEYYLSVARIAWLSPAINPAGAARYRILVSDGPGTAWRTAADRADNRIGHRTADEIDDLGRLVRVEVLDSSYVARDLPGAGDYKLIGATEVAVLGGLLYSDSASLSVDYERREISVAGPRTAAALSAQLRAVNERCALEVWRNQAPLPDSALVAAGDSVLVAETIQPGRRERYALALNAAAAGSAP